LKSWRVRGRGQEGAEEGGKRRAGHVQLEEKGRKEGGRR
jgi:hypothetical protein